MNVLQVQGWALVVHWNAIPEYHGYIFLITNSNPSEQTILRATDPGVDFSQIGIGQNLARSLAHLGYHSQTLWNHGRCSLGDL